MSRILIKRSQPPKQNEPWIPPGTEHIDWERIWLNPRVCCYVSPCDYEERRKLHYRLKRSGHCFYAARKITRNGNTYWLKLHREIMNTPQGYDCHHKNKHTLDNRRENLENLTPEEHASTHIAIC